MNDKRGALWRKWDLHVHTPASIIQNYGGDNDVVWERFLADLEALPDDFRVLGINDYIFLDGYKRVLKAKASGRLPKIDLVLPVIELRLDKFGGTDGALSRANFHVIFSEQVRAETIETYFITALPRCYRLSHEHEHLEWKAFPTRESLTDLGQKIIDSVPEHLRCEYGSPLREGFSNLNFDLDEVLRCLEDCHYFRDRFVTSVGKTEWADIKWNDRSIAEKKNIINSADLVFISSETIADFRKAKEALTSSGVNDILLDCSDAHSFSDSSGKDRIGHCFTWIKADPTFEGLCQALREPDSRIFVGSRPDKLRTVADNKTKYIRSVEIGPTEDSTLDEIWFDNKIIFNHNLVAVIGNKGMGKSALTDIVALLADSHCTEFGFLNREKFCHPREGKAGDFQATLVWESDAKVSKTLDEPVAETTVEKVKYIPQHFFEILCNEIELGEDSRFSAELKSVIFSHIADSRRLGHDSLDELAGYRTQEIQERILILRAELYELDRQIVELEDQVTAEYRLGIEQRIEGKKQELTVHDASKPETVEMPERDSKARQEIEKHRQTLTDLALKITGQEVLLAEQRQLESAAHKLSDKISNFKASYLSLKLDCSEEVGRLGLDFASLVEVSIDEAALQATIKQIETTIEDIEDKLDPLRPVSLVSHKWKVEETIQSLQEELDEADRNYQGYLDDIAAWEEKRTNIIGSAATLDSLEFYRQKLKESKELTPEKLNGLKQDRIRVVTEIHKQLQRTRDVYADLYSPVQEAISMSGLVVQEKYRLTFKATIQESRFVDKFLHRINQAARGPFRTVSQGIKRVREMLNEYDLNEEDGVASFLDRIVRELEEGQGADNVGPQSIDNQLVGGVTRCEFYDFLFGLEYLEPKYGLQLNGKDLQQLSPGERGVLLLIFYLLVDKSDCPLIIDQPEENLDSESVVEILVPYIKAAKKRRQIFIVTHNPNLAVVCDAEQIVHCFIDKTHKNQVTYTSGAIENPDINKKVVDVLEGTWPAFRNRESKYMPTE